MLETLLEGEGVSLDLGPCEFNEAIDVHDIAEVGPSTAGNAQLGAAVYESFKIPDIENRSEETINADDHAIYEQLMEQIRARAETDSPDAEADDDA